MTAGLPKLRDLPLITVLLVVALGVLASAASFEQKKTMVREAPRVHTAYAKMTHTQTRQRVMAQARSMVEAKSLSSVQTKRHAANQDRQQQSKGHGNGS